jgi:TonB family protein
MSLRNSVILFSGPVARFLFKSVCLLLLAYPALPQTPRVRVAIIDFGNSATGLHAAEAIREKLRSKAEDVSGGITVIDRDQTLAAAHGAAFEGSLNLTIQEARDLGAAIGCDFFLLGDAQTLKRSPSSKPSYYEGFASVFLVSARTGRLVLWERPIVQRDGPAEAEKGLLEVLSSADTHQRYLVAIRRAQEEERSARISAVENGQAIIEVMSDDDSATGQEVRAPRPYRRLRPPYPETAARAEVEAVVDVLVDIDARGEVGRIEIVRWAGYGLDQSVVDTIRQMHFFPAMRDGLAIPMRVLLRYNFRKPPPVPNSSP